MIVESHMQVHEVIGKLDLSGSDINSIDFTDQRQICQNTIDTLWDSQYSYICKKKFINISRYKVYLH